jgi:hypothetical protein
VIKEFQKEPNLKKYSHDSYRGVSRERQAVADMERKLYEARFEANMNSGIGLTEEQMRRAKAKFSLELSRGKYPIYDLNVPFKKKMN